MTNRTDELRNAGMRESRSPGGEHGNTPWIKWGENYNWMDVKCQQFFESKYGLCGQLLVTACYDKEGLQANGTDDEGEEYTVIVEPEMTVNLGLYSATLEGKITTDDVDKSFHIAFEGWGEAKSGNKFRMITVIPLETPETKTNSEKVAEVLDAEIIDPLPF